MKKYLGIKSAPIIIAIFIVILHFLFHNVRILGMQTSIFYMDEQITLAAYFMFTLSLIVGFIALLNYKSKLSIINSLYIFFFVVLSIDEYFEIHEKAREIISENFMQYEFLSSLFQVSWIFALALPIGAILLSLIIHTYRESNNKVRILKALGITSFCLVLLFELLGGQSYGQSIYLFFTGIEEGLEMIGVSLFFWAEYVKFSAKYKV